MILPVIWEFLGYSKWIVEFFISRHLCSLTARLGRHRLFFFVGSLTLGINRLDDIFDHMFNDLGAGILRLARMIFQSRIENLADHGPWFFRKNLNDVEMHTRFCVRIHSADASRPWLLDSLRIFALKNINTSIRMRLINYFPNNIRQNLICRWIRFFL